ncbi:MAG: pyoverdine-tailoring dipeptidase-like protein PvdM [Amphiplicatus sp.]
MKKPSARLSVLLSAFAAGSAAAQPLADPALEDEARRIHERVIALDTHVDIPLDYATHSNDPGGFTKLQVDLPKMRAGGLDAAFFIVYTPQGPLTPEGYAEARRVANARIEAIARLVRAYPDEVGVAFTAREARRIARTGKRAALIGMENAYPLGPSVEDVAAWAAAGVRYMGITHFGHNQFADSSNPSEALGDAEERYGGLSELGRSLVAELNRHGIMVDVSHAGKKTMMQAVALSAAPAIASHSGVKALADSPRNLDDEQLRALAAKGGVVQIVALDAYVKPLTKEQIALRERIREEMGLKAAEARAAMTPEVEAEYEKRLEALWDIAPRATVADFVDHIDYAVKLVGVDHVGIASDFDGGGGVVGWENAGETLNVTRELVRRGYTEEEIAKIWGGNLLRVMEEVEKTARRLR